MANLAANLGIPQSVGLVIASVTVISFAATTMDTGLRLQRYILSEIGQMYRIKPLTKPVVATITAVLICVLLSFGAQPPGGEVGSGGLVIWPLFGTTNQLLAALSLTVITIYLKRLGRSVLPTLIPMVFLLSVTSVAMVLSIIGWFGLNGATPNLLLATMGTLVLGCAVWMMFEAGLAIRNQPGGVPATE